MTKVNVTKSLQVSASDAWTKLSAMDLQYSILSGPFPIPGYVSDVSVKSMSDSSCEISWISEFNVNEGAPVEDMTGLFEGFYNTMIESLETLIQSEK